MELDQEEAQKDMTAHAGTSQHIPRSVLALSSLEGEDWNAADRAASLAGRWKCRLIVLKATDELQLSEAERHAIKGRVERRIAGLAPPRPIEVLSGAAYSNSAILEAARKFAPDLIVMGPSVVQALGSLVDTAPEASATGSRRPVLVARTGLADYTKALMATDLSRNCAEAVALVDRLELASHGRLTFLHAYSPGNEAMGIQAGTDPEGAAQVSLDAFIEHSGLSGKAEARMTGGAPAQAMLEAAAGISADIIVMGSSRRGGLTRVLTGSTVSSVLAGARCDVLVAPGTLVDER